MRPDMHTGGIPPYEKWLLRLVSAIHEVQCPSGDLLIHRLHAFPGQRTGVLDLAAREAVNHAARSKPLLELGILRIVGVLRLFLGVEVVEVAEELIEPVRRG